MGKDIVILGGMRTPMGEYNGVLSDFSAIDLGVIAAKAALKKSQVAPEEIEHTVMGNALQTSADAIYGARHVALKAGVPISSPALTVNRLCGSGIQSIVEAAHLIQLEEAKMVLAGGMESLSQAPHVIRGARKGLRLGDGKLEDLLMVSLMDPYCGFYMAQTSDNLAREHGITREEQDLFALRSQKAAAAAWEAGKFREEIVPVEIPFAKGTHDFRPRRSYASGYHSGRISRAEAPFQQRRFCYGRKCKRNCGWSCRSCRLQFGRSKTP